MTKGLIQEMMRIEGEALVSSTVLNLPCLCSKLSSIAFSLKSFLLNYCRCCSSVFACVTFVNFCGLKTIFLGGEGEFLHLRCKTTSLVQCLRPSKQAGNKIICCATKKPIYLESSTLFPSWCSSCCWSSTSCGYTLLSSCKYH